jgi:peptidoglycan/LPS O-acetylase OafA/YrhL
VRRTAGLDGLRALAVTAVLLYHGGLAAVPGGFLGVDLFFSISGFLITTLLLRELVETGRVDVIAFWARRVRRLLPGLALVVAATLLTVAVAPSIYPSDELRSDAVAALLYVANWHFLGGDNGYFEQLAAPSPLLHTWSLAIEEQFYVAWPVLLVAVGRRQRWTLTSSVAAAAGGSACWMAVLAVSGASTDRVYYGTDTRAQTILAGAVAALLLDRAAVAPGSGRRRRRRLPTLAGPVAFLALTVFVLAMVLVDEQDPALYRGGLTTVALVAAVLVTAVARAPQSVTTRLLDLRPLRYVGERSYGLYLWHWPVFLVLTAGRTSLSGLGLLAVRLAVTLVLAAASLRLVENPLRHGDWHLPRAVGVPAGAAAVACGLLLVVPGGLPATLATLPGAAPAPGGNPTSSRRAPGDLEPDAVLPPRPAVTAPAVVEGPQPLRVTVLGDSTARTLAEGLRDIPGESGVSFHDAAVLGCGVAYGSPYRYLGEINPYPRERCSSWARRWRRAVAAHPVDVVAVLVGRWEVADQVVDGVWTHVGEPRFDRYLRQQLELAVQVTTAGGADVAFLTAPYCSRGEQPNGSTWPEDDPRRVDAYNDVLRSVAARHPGTAHVIELGRRTAGGGRSYVREVDGVVLRYDGVHFTSGAARWLEPWLVRELERTVNAA